MSLFKRFALSFIWFITVLLGLYLLVTYVFSYTLLSTHWLAQLMMLCLGIGLLSMFGLMAFWLLVRPARALLPLGVLLLGWPFVQRTFSISWEGRTRTPLRVLSFNTSGFRADEYRLRKDSTQAIALLEWSENFDADIKCFQEFHSWNRKKLFRTFDRFRKNTPHYAEIWPKPNPDYPQKGMGPVIFSKYPILRSEGKFFISNPGERWENNGVVIADIALPQGTVRVINVHLWSMGVRVGRVAEGIRNEDLQKTKTQSRHILQSLRQGLGQHVAELEYIEPFISRSPYPVLLCGDLNEAPYGHAYGKLHNYLGNAFEAGGNGLGFTLNRSPWLMRIDHQFYDRRWQVVSCEVHREVTGSDHFPVSATYCLE
jgi:endonuclease/exonuclease/phosphatase family metal-dependent hydrolase